MFGRKDYIIMKNRAIKNCILSFVLAFVVIFTVFAFTACSNEPTETVTIIYEERDDGILITGYEGTLASETELAIPTTINGKDVVAIADGAFAGRSDLTRVYIPATVVAIGEGAFRNCKNLVSANIPNNLTEIRDNTFYGCKSLTEVNVPESVTSIGDGAFDRCESIESLTVPGWALDTFDIASLKSLNIRGDLTVTEGMFKECTSLQTLTLPYVGSDAAATANTHFGYVFGAPNAESNSQYVPSTLSKVVITGGTEGALKVIDDKAFYGCTSIKTVMLPTRLETIGASAFEGCSSLTKINIPATVTYIGGSAFASTSVTSATIPAGITAIGEKTFYNCSSLESLTLGRGVASIGEDAFAGCTALNALYVGSVEQWLAFDFDSCLDSPLYYAGNLYIGGELAEEIVIPASVTEIGDNAFYRCTSVKSIVLHDNIGKIGDYAFAGCISLKNIGKTNALPSSLTSIGTAAFSNCASLPSIVIPESVTELGSYAFNLCTSLATLEFNASVTELGEAAFRGAALVDVSISSNITAVGKDAFADCSRIKTIVAPSAVINVIAKKNLQSVVFTSGDTVADGLFAGAKNLESVSLPESVTSVGEDAFAGCARLVTVSFGEKSRLTTVGGGAFAGCSRLIYLTLPSALTEISEDAFAGCYRLAEVYNLSALEIAAGDDGHGGVAKYAYSVKTTEQSDYVISGNYVFYKNGDENLLIGYFGRNSVLSLPDSLNGERYTIASRAFADTNMNVLTIPSMVESCREDAFIGISSVTELEAPVWILNELPDALRAGVITLGITDGTTVTSATISGYTSLVTLNLASTVTSVYAQYLAKIDTLEAIEVDAENTVYYSEEGHLYRTAASGDVLVRACPASADFFTLPTTVVEIGDYAFYNCDNLSTLYIEAGSVLNRIGNYAFYDADILYSIEMPSTISYIGTNAFALCDYLSDIEIDGESARYVAKDGCLIDKSTKTVIFGYGERATVTADGKEISYDSCIIPSDGSVTSIAPYAFYEQSTIERIVLPAGITVSDNAFGALSALELIELTGDAHAYTVADGCLIRTATKELILATVTAKIPENADLVTTITDTAFAGNTAITSIVIPSTITKIENGAFDGCTNISSVTAPVWAMKYFDGELVSTVTLNGDGAITADTFAGFTALEALNIGAGISSAAEGALKDATSLSKITVAADNAALKFVDGCLIDVAGKTVITAIHGTKDDGTKLPVVPSDGSVTKIGAYAFAGKDKITSVVIPAAVTEIAESAFLGVLNLTAVSIPAEFVALVPAEKVTSLTVNGGTTLDRLALSAYASLTDITIGASVSDIQLGAFAVCPTLKSVTVDAGNTTYKVIDGCIVSGTTLIAAVGAASVPVDGRITAIADYAFAGNTTVTSVAVAACVTSVGTGALEGCTALRSVYYAGSDWESVAAAASCPDGVTVYIYSESAPTTEGNYWYISDGKVKIWW